MLAGSAGVGRIKLDDAREENDNLQGQSYTDEGTQMAF
jgi:hypothetical protein